MKFDVFRPDRPGIRKVLGDLEAEILEYVWLHSKDGGPVSVRSIYEDLKSRRQIAYTTVMSTMARLARKGVLDVDTSDQAYRYRPRMSEPQMAQKIVEHVVNSLIVNFKGETLAYVKGLEAEAAKDKAALQNELRGEIQRRRRRRQP